MPLIYLAEDFDGKQVVVDGQQRLDAVFSYIDGDLILTGLTVMEELSDSIRESLLNLLVNDEEFIASIDQHTSDEDSVQYRFETWLRELDEVLADSDDQGPRLFSLKLKEELFNADPTCKICGQRLHSIDDSEVDHIEPYWKGGHTIPENARLTHRYCNRARRRQAETRTYD